MASKVKVIATYRPNDAEVYQCVVTLDAFPDAIDEARSQAVRGVHDMLADAIAQDDARKAAES